jgi:hypothetical protein
MIRPSLMQIRHTSTGLDQPGSWEARLVLYYACRPRTARLAPHRDTCGGQARVNEGLGAGYGRASEATADEGTGRCYCAEDVRILVMT